MPIDLQQQEVSLSLNCNYLNGFKINLQVFKYNTFFKIGIKMALNVSAHLLGGCVSLLLVDADDTACPRPTAGLPAPVEALPGR